MLNGVVQYLQERKSGLQKAAGYVGGAYLVGQYVLGRLEDVRTTVMQDRLARDNLRRRFEQNQQDISFTIMALLPTLGRHILEGMDVEGVTCELQSYSRSAKAPSPVPPAPAAPLESSLSSSVELVSQPQHPDHSGNSSFSMLQSVKENGVETPTDLSTSSASWVDQLSSVQLSEVANGHAQEPVANGTGFQMPSLGTDPPLSDSVLSTSTSSSSSVAMEASAPGNGHAHSTNTPVKSKAELWNEVKILTFTRTLTIIYSMTLLTLFTHVQLSILGRAKYIHSVLQTEQEERMREQMLNASFLSLLWDDSTEGEPAQCAEVISEETERKFLTLSWWILHVGWKDVGERVRRGVEEVFEGVSLKTKFTINDLFRLVSDVRRRVEFEVTFEGRERRINFMSTLLPPTPETLHHVLTQGGIPNHVANNPDPKFEYLLAETRTHILSASFQHVLETCLDQATETLFSGLRKHVFGGADGLLNFEDRDDEVRERLAAMLPGLARWCHLALEGLPNEMVDNLSSLRETAALSAIIYTSYEDRFS